MLGRVRRTTRADVGLAISFGGVAYLVWVLAVGVGRHAVNGLSKAMYADRTAVGPLPGASRWLWQTFLHAAPLLDMAGVLWLVLSLILIVGSSRQRWSISWAWTSAICQAMGAALLAVWASVGGQGPFTGNVISHPAGATYPTTGWTFMSVAVCVALVLWVTVLVWLLYERARLRRGPSMRDGLRTHVPG